MSREVTNHELATFFLALVVGVLLVLSQTGCANSGLAKRGVPQCRHYAIAWCEARQAEGYSVAIVTMINRRTKKAYTVCKAVSGGKWVHIDPQTGQEPDMREYDIVDVRTDIGSPAPRFVVWSE